MSEDRILLGVVTCWKCNGSGRTGPVDCIVCGGTGKTK